MLFAVIILNLCLVEGREKIWSPPESKDPWKYIGNNRKCSDENLVFPKYLSSGIILPRHLNPIQMILPATGAIIIQDQEPLSFKRELDCSLESISSDYKLWKLGTKSWYLSENWITSDGPMNSAWPHMDRIPCDCDTIIFPKNQSISVDLWATNDIVAHQIEINGKHENFQKFLETELGQLMFQNTNPVNFEVSSECAPKQQEFCGCHSRNRFNEFKEVVCFEEAGQCQIPHCLNPIKPIGYCCPICGASLKFPSNEQTCKAQLDTLNRFFQKILTKITDGRYLDLTDYYMSYLPDGAQDFVQLNIVDKGEYQGYSTELVDILEKHDQFLGNTFDKFKSGRPFIPSHSSNFWILFFGTLALVTGFFSIIYVHYVKQCWKLIPTKRLDFFSSPFMFARFDNTAGDDETDGHLVVVGFSEHSADGANLSMAQQNADEDGNAEERIQTINPEVLNDFDEDDFDTSSVSNLVEVELDSSEYS